MFNMTTIKGKEHVDIDSFVSFLKEKYSNYEINRKFLIDLAGAIDYFGEVQSITIAERFFEAEYQESSKASEIRSSFEEGYTLIRYSTMGNILTMTLTRVKRYSDHFALPLLKDFQEYLEQVPSPQDITFQQNLYRTYNEHLVREPIW